MECGRKLGTYLRKRQKMRREGERRDVFERYIGEIAKALNAITGEDARSGLRRAARAGAARRRAVADQQLDEDGKVVKDEDDDFDEDGVIVVPESDRDGDAAPLAPPALRRADGEGRRRTNPPARRPPRRPPRSLRRSAAAKSAPAVVADEGPRVRAATTAKPARGCLRRRRSAPLLIATLRFRRTTPPPARRTRTMANERTGWQRTRPTRA
jgi:hypothetical protein